MELKINDDKTYLEIVKIDNINELNQIRQSLTRKVKNYRFLPAVKSGQWSGDVFFYDNKDRIPIGLWKYCYDKMKEFGYKCNIQNLPSLFDNKINETDFKNSVNTLFENSKIQPREYQIDAAFKILKYRRTTSLMSTSSGKTLVVYTVLSYGLQNNLMKNILMIVPNVSLVIQATNDFFDYNRGHDIKIRIQQVYSGQEEYYGTNITIGTYQSLVKFDMEFFKKFDTVIIDETHQSAAKSIITIMKNLQHCNYRFGLTGTLPNENVAEYLTIISQTGPVVNKIGADALIQEGFITPIKITILRLNYVDDEVKKSFYELSKRMDGSKLYNEEKKFVITSKKRLNFIVNLISKGKMNSLVLFHRIEYGKQLYDELKKIKPNDVYYVSGITKATIREDYKKILENNTVKNFIVLEFNNFEIKIKSDLNVLLTNGTYKKAELLNLDDDIDEIFINKYKK